MAATQKEIVDAVASALQHKNLSQQAVAVIHRSTEKVLKRIQQDVGAQFKEDGDDVVEDFCKNLATKLGQMSQNWYDGIRNELIVYPEGTRFIYRDGTTVVIVVEQQPQVRTINVNGTMHHLAFPYVVFIMGFNNGAWNGALDVAIRTRPLTSLDDPLCSIGLPNISGYRVCMGDFRNNPKTNMTEQTQAVIGSFWQSQFGGDIRNLPSWERQTKRDPLYVLHENYTQVGPLRQVVSAVSRNAGERPDIVNTLKQEIITAVGTIGAEIQKTMLTLDMVKQNKEKVHIETLDEILKEIIVQAYAELWEYLQAQLQRERAKMQQEMVSLLKRKTGYSDEYEKTTKWGNG
jgi:hypothetical protein